MTYDEADLKIKKLLNKEFLIKLTEICRLYGDSGDNVAIGQFINELYYFAKMKIPSTKPYKLIEQ